MCVEDLNLATGRMRNCRTDDTLADIPVAMEELEGIAIQSKTTHGGGNNGKL